jgi:CHAT domain-containing protein
MTSLLPGLVLSISCLSLFALQRTDESLDLTPGHPVSVLLTPEHSASLHLNLATSEAEEIFLDAAVPEISFRIVSRDGTKIRSGRIPTAGWTAIPVASAGQSQVELLLSTQSPTEGLPGVRVRVERFPVPLNTLPAHIRAEQAFASAQSLHRSLRVEDLRRAINQFQQAAGEWGRCGDLHGEALALGGKSESQIELSQYREALQTLEQALGLDQKNAYLRGWLFHLKARVYLDQWEPKPAKPVADEELRLGQKIDDSALIALAHSDLAGVAYWSEDLHANEITAQAHVEAVLAGVPETLALERRCKAWLEENDVRNVRAIAAMSEAEGYFRRAGDLRNALEATAQGAVAVALNGNPYSALAKLSELQPIAKASGNNVDYGVLLENMGNEQLDLGNPKIAEVYFLRAESLYSRAHFRFGLMAIYGQMCEVKLRLNQLSSAIANCKLSLALAYRIQDPVLIGTAEYQLGLTDRQAGKAPQAFIDFTNAAKNSHIYNDLRAESNERIQLGELLEQAGKRPEALAQYLKAESLTQGVDAPASLLEAQYSVARWYSHDGQYEKASAELEPALQKLETARQMVSDSTLQATYFAAERKCYELAVELQMREFKRDPAEGGDALALELSEQSRARALLDALKARSTTAGRERSDAQANLMYSNIGVDRAFDRRLKLLVEGGTKSDLDASAAELTQALGDMERAEDKVHANASQAPKPMPTMSAAEIERGSLGSGATFFEYALGAERSYLWVIDRGKRKSYVLPSREQLENMVKQWRTLAASRKRFEADARAKFQLLSSQLSCALLADAVDAHMTRMVIVPDGSLVMLPFAALPENSCSGMPGKPLVVEHEITLTPSLSIFLSRKPTAENQAFQGEVAIVADPVFDMADPRAATLKTGESKRGMHPARAQEIAVALPRLLNTGYEASAIQEAVRKAAGNNQVFLAQGFDASVETVLSPAMQNYRIWHLATHGVYDETMPEFSGLVFSLVGPDGRPRFGFLKAHDISSLNVGADLIVLSACDSAAGENLSGEGVMGLSYSFLRAGARQVLSTLWSIDDSTSRELMIAFYKELMRNGGNTAAALRQSQLVAMRQPHSSAPYYWAGFELTSLGNKASLPIPQRMPSE